MNFSRIANEYSPEIGAMGALVFVAAVELACDLGSGEYAVTSIARPAASLFLILAVGLALGIARLEYRRSFNGSES